MKTPKNVSKLHISCQDQLATHIESKTTNTLKKIQVNGRNTQNRREKHLNLLLKLSPKERILDKMWGSPLFQNLLAAVYHM